MGTLFRMEQQGRSVFTEINNSQEEQKGSL
jgi:hypothetical protein